MISLSASYVGILCSILFKFGLTTKLLKLETGATRAEIILQLY